MTNILPDPILPHAAGRKNLCVVTCSWYAGGLAFRATKLQSGGRRMLGELFSESRGKRIVRRVLATEPPKVEVSFEESGKMLGTETVGIGTYCSAVRSDGTLLGEGQGVLTTKEGEMITWTGSGLGKFNERGGVSFRGILYYRTASKKLARLNGIAGVFEHDVDEQGNTQSKAWEWK
jgi:hypothetical protein